MSLKSLLINATINATTTLVPQTKPGNFTCVLSSADFFQNHLRKNSKRNTIRASNSFDPDQARHFVGPDLGPNCLQRLSADHTSKQRAWFSER